MAPDLSLSSSLTWYPPPGSATTKTSEFIFKDNVKDTLDQLAQNVKRSRSKWVPDAVLGADDDLDDLLFRDEYQKHGTDKVGWIDLLTFLRLERDHQAEGEVVDQRKWTWNATNRKDGPRTMQNSQVSWPKIKYVLHSWDFMPADCPKPLASSTVGDIAVIVRRLGMVWKEFKPGEGRMSAEGGPHVINSMEQRGLGIVLQYRCLDDTLLHNVRETRRRREARQKATKTTTQQKSEGAEKCGSLRKRLSKVEPRAVLQIKDEESGADNGSSDMRKEDVAINHGIKERLQRFWRGMSSEEDREAEGEEEEEEGTNNDMSDGATHWNPMRSMNLNQDKFMFGWIPSDPALNIPDFPHATPKECSDVLVDLTGHSRLHEYVERNGRDDFNDLLYLAPEAFRQRGKERDVLHSRNHLASAFYKSVGIFADTLKKYLNGEDLAKEFQWNQAAMGEAIRPTQIGSDLKEYFLRILDSLETLDLDKIQSYHEDTTRFFKDLEKEQNLRFQDLLGAHFSIITSASGQIREKQKSEYEKYRTRYDREDWKMRQWEKNREYWDDAEWKYRRQSLQVSFCRMNKYHGSGSGCGFTPHFGPDPLAAFWQQEMDSNIKTRCWEEAWIMLMLRGFLYRELHDILAREFTEETYLDRKYYKSKIPVWLG